MTSTLFGPEVKIDLLLWPIIFKRLIFAVCMAFSLEAYPQCLMNQLSYEYAHTIYGNGSVPLVPVSYYPAISCSGIYGSCVFIPLLIPDTGYSMVCDTAEEAWQMCSSYYNYIQGKPFNNFYSYNICSTDPFYPDITFRDPRWPYWPPNPPPGSGAPSQISYGFLSDCPKGATFNAMTHQCEGRTVIIDPGHGQILKNGVPTYQRPPSPTYGLIEDELTLQIAIQLKSLLEAENIKVFMLRETSLAPYAPPDCSVPCIRDLEKRREQAENLLDDKDKALMVSIHTNAGTPTAHGTESFYSPLSPPDSSALAQSVLSQLSALGLSNRGVKTEEFLVLNSAKLPSTLVEVAFHTNSILGSGQTITDETFLNTDTSSAAFAIFTAIKDYYEN